jgi:hypothetical protein
LLLVFLACSLIKTTTTTTGISTRKRLGLFETKLNSRKHPITTRQPIRLTPFDRMSKSLFYLSMYSFR